MAHWKEDKLWADTYLPLIQKTVRKLAGKIITVEEATVEEDQKQATDYKLVTVDGGSIGCRIRKGINFFITYHDLTIRSHRPSGAVTELEKIKAGFPKWYFYGWTDGMSIPYWIFVDMDRFRNSDLIDNPKKKNVRNFDGSSYFNGYDVFDLYKYNCVLDQSNEVKEFVKDRNQMRIVGQAYNTWQTAYQPSRVEIP